MMRRIVTMSALIPLAACSLAPHYVRPELPVPTSWPAGDAYLRQSEATLPAVAWRDVFRDPRLQKIIEQALANNRDLRVSLANITAARAQYRIQRADIFPEVDASGRYTYTHSNSGISTSTGSGSGTGTGSGTGSGTGTGIGTGTGTGSSTGSSITSTRSGSTFLADVGVTSFEFDLFGRVRSLTTAALDRYFATEAAARATRLTLLDEVATAWLTYAADKSLLVTAQNTANVAEASVRLTKARLDGGISPRTDLTQAQSILASALSSLAAQRTQIAQDANALQLLVGAPVDPSLLPGSIDEAAPTIAELPAGISSEVLLRRPDVVEAEYTLRAYNAEIGSARAELFPRITLTGLVGLASQALSSLFTGGAFNYSAAGSVTYPIFRAGAARANVKYTEAQRDAALAAYEQTIQAAFRDVADALARQGTIGDQLRANRLGVSAAQTTLDLVNAQYRGGVTTFLSSLDAQRTLFAAQQTYVATQLTAASNRATLYEALGGDQTLDADAKGPHPVTPAGKPRSG